YPKPYPRYERRGQILKVVFSNLRSPVNVQEYIEEARGMVIEHISKELKIEDIVFEKQKGQEFLGVKLDVKGMPTSEALAVLVEAVTMYENFLLMKRIEKELY
ncbi:MAG: hypothetical protein IBX72_16005, partial [Nitrospirae bacterium]|nr:hypothetical protein [Nitrospirota bacterium]